MRPKPVHARTDSRPMLTSTVLVVVMRVAGPVDTRVRAHAIGHPERQVSLRVGDVVVHLTDPAVAGMLRQRWDAGLGAALRLRERVSQTWLAPRPGTYSAAISLQLNRQTEVTTRFVAADCERHQPCHVEVRINQLLFQVCDLTAWLAIGDAWMAAQQHLEQ